MGKRWGTSWLAVAVAILASALATEAAATCVDEAPRPVIVATGWADTGTIVSPAQYWRDVNCVVHFSGAIYQYSPGGGDAIIIPDGYGPRQFEYFSVLAPTQYTFFDQSVVVAVPRGTCTLCRASLQVRLSPKAQTEGNGWVSLSGITYLSTGP